MTTDRSSGLVRQIESAKKQIRQLKKVTPHIFPEWQRLQNAKAELAEAQQRLEAAQAAWEAL
jgi:chromosome segregation ATPase